MEESAQTKTVKLTLGVWYNERSRHIHLSVPDQFISTVSPDPKSKRYHPSLYRKLAQALCEAGKPCPATLPDGEEFEAP